ncbi:MAG: peptide chain release factor N(5)-glutamine methyltransferase [Chloroflexi bacterium]|nr:peptide chain release factor N(5)-glutamine methyltransferase [Chloroflexota bacterium]
MRQSAGQLQEVTDIPRLEAEVLLAHVLQSSRTTLLAHPEQALSADQFWRYADIVRQRSTGYPLPYLTGTAEFYALSFEVTPEVLIPRPETEILVDLALARRPTCVVDVGTGSGCIAIALAAHLPEAQITGIELSPAALAVAQRNAERHGVADRIQWIVGDVLVPRPGPADLIVSNPPYVRTSEMATLPVSVRSYEPAVALDGGADGLVTIRQLLNQAPAVLGPDGCLLMEIGVDQAEAAIDLARTAFPQAQIYIHPDLAGHDRVLEVSL